MEQVKIKYTGSNLDKVSAIKGIRQLSGWNLKTSKDIMDSAIREGSIFFTIMVAPNVPEHQVLTGIHLLEKGGFLVLHEQPHHVTAPFIEYADSCAEEELIKQLKELAKEAIDCGAMNIAIELLEIASARLKRTSG